MTDDLQRESASAGFPAWMSGFVPSNLSEPAGAPDKPRRGYGRAVRMVAKPGLMADIRALLRARPGECFTLRELMQELGLAGHAGPLSGLATKLRRRGELQRELVTRGNRQLFGYSAGHAMR